MDNQPLRVWVFEGVLCDYTCGMAVVVAHSVEEAVATMNAQLPEYVLYDLPFTAAREITAPEVVYVSGEG